MGAPLKVPAGKAGGESVDRVEIRPQFAFERRNQVHHVRVALHIHQVFYLYRPVLAHSSQIIAAQIDQHDVFGAFFFVGAHFLFQLAIGRVVLPARMRARDRPVFQLRPCHAHQHFRRRAQHVRVAHAQEIHIWRWIYGAQRAIQVEGATSG